MSTTSLVVAQSGEGLRGEGLVWFIGAVVCLLDRSIRIRRLPFTLSRNGIAYIVLMCR